MKREAKGEKGSRHRIFALELSSGENMLEMMLRDHKEVMEWMQTHAIEAPSGRGLLGLVQDITSSNSNLRADRIRLEQEKQDLEKVVQQQKQQQLQARECQRKELRQLKDERDAHLGELEKLRRELLDFQTRVARSEAQAAILTEERLEQTKLVLTQLGDLQCLVLQMQAPSLKVMREIGTQTNPAPKKRAAQSKQPE